MITLFGPAAQIHTKHIGQDVWTGPASARGKKEPGAQLQEDHQDHQDHQDRREEGAESTRLALHLIFTFSEKII